MDRSSWQELRARGQCRVRALGCWPLSACLISPYLACNGQAQWGAAMRAYILAPGGALRVLQECQAQAASTKLRDLSARLQSNIQQGRKIDIWKQQARTRDEPPGDLAASALDARHAPASVAMGDLAADLQSL